MAATMAAIAANSDFPTFLIGATFNFQIYANSPNLYHSSLPNLNAAALWPFPTPVPPPVPPSEGGTISRIFHSPSEGGQKPYCPESPLWPRLAFLRTHHTFRRWDDFPHFLLTFQRRAEAVLPREPTVAAISFPPDTSHLPKVGRFPAFSTHLPKMDRKNFAENLVYKINQFIFAP